MTIKARRFIAGYLFLVLATVLPPILSAEGGSAGGSGLALIPAGDFEMGDHQGFVDPKHGGDETPIHAVRLDAFHIGINDVTTAQFCEFLNSAYRARNLEVRGGGVYLSGGKDLLCETRTISPYSRIDWNGKAFLVLDRKEDHPVVCIRWEGAAAYCNWLSARQGLPTCYDEVTWTCDFAKAGYRLPTEAEWEHAARGDLKDPYRVFPWGDEADASKANWPESKNPFRAGPEPWTTPVGFFDGGLKKKADFGWPGAEETYQTSNGANGFGLYDMSGNVWQFVNDWYGRDYYAASPAANPMGPSQGSVMPDGKPYRGMRGGSWYNGENGHGRVANRNPSYYRGPQDPDHPYYHLGFRVARSAAQGSASSSGSVSALAAKPSGAASALSGAAGSGFTLSSPAVVEGGSLPAKYTADGASTSPPLSWKGAPEGTKSYALIMHHIDPQGVSKWYWTVYNIPASAHELPENSKSIGTTGGNSVNNLAAYAPPQSSGPGPKTYTITLYALSEALKMDVQARQVTRDTLLAAMKGCTLSSAQLSFVYTRPGESPAQAEKRVREEGAAGQAARKAEPPADQKASPAPENNKPQAQGIQTGKAQPRAEAAAASEGGKTEGKTPGGEAAMPENKTPVSLNPGQTVGLFMNTPEAFKGYTLFSPKHNTVTYLMDNEGRVVHQWKSAYEPGQSAYLKPNGNLVRCGFTKNDSFIGGGEGGRIEEYDWDGNLVWEFDYSSTAYLSHHDIALLPNGNILMLVVEKKTIEECLAVGFDPKNLRDKQLYPDSVVEVQPTYPKGGKVVWQWRVWDHLIQDFDKTKPFYGKVSEHPELIDVDANGRAVPSFWNHMNSISYNADLDQVMLSVRGCNEIWLLDHSTTTKEASGHTGGKHGKGGDLIYRWGNPAAYGRGTVSDAQLVQQHDAEWIPKGYPGAGNITIFNNGYDRLWSSVEEIVPPIGSDGKYILASGKAYGPEKSEWHYEAANRTDFFSSEISGASRLPNGNTLICAGVIGTLFEVTPSGDTVWQYVNPMVRGGILAQGELPGKDVRGHLFNAVFKVHRYPLDYPAFAGRTLSPQGVIELPASQKGKTGLDGLSEQAGENRDPPGTGNKPNQAGNSGGGQGADTPRAPKAGK